MIWWEGGLLFGSGFLLAALMISGGLVWMSRNPQRLIQWWMKRAVKVKKPPGDSLGPYPGPLGKRPR